MVAKVRANPETRGQGNSTYAILCLINIRSTMDTMESLPIYTLYAIE
jgi:hypothetical protein